MDRLIALLTRISPRIGRASDAFFGAWFAHPADLLAELHLTTGDEVEFIQFVKHPEGYYLFGQIAPSNPLLDPGQLRDGPYVSELAARWQYADQTGKLLQSWLQRKV